MKATLTLNLSIAAGCLDCCSGTCPGDGDTVSLVFSAITPWTYNLGGGDITYDPNISIDFVWAGGGEVYNDPTAASGQGAVIFMSCVDGVFVINYYLGDADYYAFVGTGFVSAGTMDTSHSGVGGSNSGTVTWTITPP